MVRILSLHPTSSAIGGVVQAIGGVGEQGVALVLQVEEVAVGRVDTAWREAEDGVCGDKEASARCGEYLAPYEK